jgi:hypothetical protein
VIQSDYAMLIQGLLGDVADGNPEVIVGNDNGPRPEKPYAAVFLEMARPLPRHHTGKPEEGIRRVQAHRASRLQVHCYGDVGEAQALADLISMRLMTDAGIEAALAKNIAWMSQPTLASIPALVDNGDYEDRAILTVETTYNGDILEDVGVIETVVVEANTEPVVMGPVEFEVTAP